MKKKRTKFFASSFIMFGLIVMLLLMFGIWIMVLFPFLKGGNEVTSLEEMTTVFIVVSVILIVTILTFFSVAHKGFSVFEISETGVKRSLFRVFKKVEMRWDEMYEIRCYGMISAWLFFSKTCLEGIPYNGIIKRKDVIQVECNKKMLDLIKEYTDKEIVNLPENFKSTKNTK